MLSSEETVNGLAKATSVWDGHPLKRFSNDVLTECCLWKRMEE